MTGQDSPHESRRAQRARRQTRRRRHRRWLTVIAAVVAAAAVVTSGLVVSGAVELPGDHADTARAQPSSRRTTTTAPGPVLRPRHRSLSHTEPLRLWIAGDSLAGSLGPSLGELTAATGVVQPQYDSRVSSGLLNPGFFNWPKHVAQELDRLDPEVVVFVIGMNDAVVWDKSRTADYTAETELMMRTLAAHGRQVYWVGPPVTRASNLERGVKAVGLIAQEAAQRVPRVTYVDAHRLFADSRGNYQQSFADETGTRHVMRAGDGIHFSVDGADYLAREIFGLLDREWGIGAQADPSHPLAVRQTRGSTQVPGTHRSGGSTSATTRSASSASSSTTSTTLAATTSTTSASPPSSSSTSTSTTSTP